MIAAAATQLAAADQHLHDIKTICEPYQHTCNADVWRVKQSKQITVTSLSSYLSVITAVYHF
jgi:hypothetical protein